MRTLALALVLLTSTLQSAYGLLCNMAPAPGMLRSPLRRLPAPDATATIGTTSLDAWTEPEHIPAVRLAEISSEIRHSTRVYAKIGPLGGPRAYGTRYAHATVN